jgi:serine/threonine-protein kinase RsbW
MTGTVERQVELSLPMVEDIELAVIKTAADLARSLGMGSSQIDEVSHAIIEACINAREHACCDDDRIYLRFLGGLAQDGRPKLEVWITDHGVGFDPKTIRKREPSNPRGPQKRGWGLQIIRAHVDDLDIDSGPGGTTVHMVKYGEKRRDD